MAKLEANGMVLEVKSLLPEGTTLWAYCKGATGPRIELVSRAMEPFHRTVVRHSRRRVVNVALAAVDDSAHHRVAHVNERPARAQVVKDVLRNPPDADDTARQYLVRRAVDPDLAGPNAFGQ